MASNLPNTEIIEPPRVIGDGPVMPRKKINYILGLMLGLLLPGSIIIIRELIRNVIISKEEIQQITKIPVLGYILTKPRGKKDDVVFTDPDLPVVESFRRIAANLPYFSKGASQQVIMVTSSISGEGKSFCAYNLASVMALKGIKTVLTAFDMRKSEFYEDLNFDCKQGISSILTNQIGLNDAFSESRNENLVVIPPGPVPPNPAELITSSETEKLIEELKRSFEVIIIDTPPIGILADAIYILKLADIKIFISRINYSPKGIFINTINELENKELKNITVLINDYKEAGSLRYNYHYKYYRNRRKKSHLFYKNVGLNSKKKL
jgi:capsular exopolysaccharide synthesis family protein